MFIVASLQAGDATELYSSGNQAYRDGEFTAAIDHYLESIGSGACDSRLYYNLGNAYFRDGQIGKAILSLERARFLAPRDRDVLNNLEFIRKTRVDVILDSEDRRPVADVYENTPIGLFYKLLGKFTFAELVWASAIFTIFGTVALFLVFALKGRIVRFFKVLALILWIFAGLIMIPYSLKRTSAWETKKAIILSERAELRSEPTNSSQLKYTLKEGMEVAVEETRGDFSRVMLRNGEDGWLPNSAFELVIPRQ